MNYLSKLLSLMLLFILGSSQIAFSQEDSSSLYNRILHFPDRLFKKVNDKTEDINRRLDKQTDKYLQRLAKQEKRLRKKVAAKDSSAAKRIFDGVQEQYAGMDSRVRNASAKASATSKKYIPHMDTLKSAFGFLAKTDGLMKNLPETQGKITEAMGKLDGLQDKFNQAEDVKAFIQKRRQLLQEQLGKYGLAKNLKSYQKQVYYYQAQVDEYKRMFDDPSKLEAKAIELLKKTAMFRDFFNKNSELASLFRLPGSFETSVASLAGLQTRESIQQDLLQRFGSGPNVQQMMQEQVQGAQAQLSQLKDKVTQLGGSGSEEQMPDFKPNNQKTKSFKSRLELGSNLQTVKSNRFFPSTSDIGLSLGYKLNEKSTVGIGSSYKMGWGKDIRHISISHQGVGLRTFVDYKIKGSFWLSGGAEMNYRSQFSDFDVLNNYTAWQRSALLGLSKKYQASKKLKGNAQIMYDALWKQQVPRTQPVVFRLGYTFK